MTSATDTLRSIVDYAYEHGLHEVGYDVVAEALHIAHNEGMWEAAEFCNNTANEYSPRNNDDYAASTMDWIAMRLRDMIQPPPPRRTE